jgi:ribonuclease BN (tRNA processing enzyme)
MGQPPRRGARLAGARTDRHVSRPGLTAGRGCHGSDDVVGRGPLELTVLGAGPAYTDRPGATGASYLLRSGVSAIVLDLGQGSFPALASRLEPSSLEAIFVSHLHPDHFIDLVALRHYLRFEFSPPRRVTVHAPAGLAKRVDDLHAEPGFTAAVLDVHDLEAGTMRSGPFEVDAIRVTHTPESYGFRVAAGPGRGLVYSGDCGKWEDLARAIRPGDVLLTEASFGPGPVPEGAFHLDGPAVGRLAAATHPSRVLLTHIQMGFDRGSTVDAVRAAFPGEVEIVDPGYVTEI